MNDKFMYISNDDAQNYPFWRLQLLIETFGHWTKWPNQNSIKVPKVIMPTNTEMLLKDFGDYCNKQPNVPSLPDKIHTSDWATEMFIVSSMMWISGILRDKTMDDKLMYIQIYPFCTYNFLFKV